mgnify:CR=1 FL=1
MNRYQSLSEQFYGNRLLFGDLADAGVVAVEIASSTEVEVFRRRVGADGPALVSERRPPQLFVFIAIAERVAWCREPHRAHLAPRCGWEHRAIGARDGERRAIRGMPRPGS